MSESAPSVYRPSYDQDPDDLDAALDVAEARETSETTVDADTINNAAEETFDNDLPTEGPGITYPEGEQAWETPKAYSKEETWEPRTPEELSTHEDLEGSEVLRQQIKDVAFTRIHEVKGKIEDSKDTLKHKYLSKKQEHQQAKYEKFDHEAKNALFQRQRERNAMKAKWAKRRLNTTNANIAHLETKHKQPLDNEGKPKIDKKTKGIQFSKAEELRIKQLTERRRELEKRRNVLLENKIIANYEKRLRGEEADIAHARLSDSSQNQLAEAILQARPIEEFRQSVKSLLRTELDKRVDAYEKIVRDEREQKLQAKGKI